MIKNDNLEGRVLHRVGVLRVWGHILRGLGYLLFVGSLSSVPCALIVASASVVAPMATTTEMVFAGLGVGGLVVGVLLALSSFAPAVTLIVSANLLFGFADHLELQYLIYAEATMRIPPTLAPKPSRPNYAPFNF